MCPRRDPPPDPPQHHLGRRPLRGRRPPFRRPLRAGLRRRAPQRRQVRPSRLRQRARPYPPALARLSRPARRRGPPVVHLRALSACRRLAERRRARRGRGPEPAAARPRRKHWANGAVDRRGDGWDAPRPQRLQAGRGRQAIDPARLRAGGWPRQRAGKPPRRLAPGKRGEPARGRRRTGRAELPAVQGPQLDRGERAERHGARCDQRPRQDVRHARGRPPRQTSRFGTASSPSSSGPRAAARARSSG